MTSRRSATSSIWSGKQVPVPVECHARRGVPKHQPSPRIERVREASTSRNSTRPRGHSLRGCRSLGLHMVRPPFTHRHRLRARNAMNMGVTLAATAPSPDRPGSPVCSPAYPSSTTGRLTSLTQEQSQSSSSGPPPSRVRPTRHSISSTVTPSTGETCGRWSKRVWGSRRRHIQGANANRRAFGECKEPPGRRG